ncbi:Yip1 family protein [Pelotomaculum propionicicum]|uniref:Yip1 domain-containing protein n=1 Tax=Pelotomaculum propionicicum TaxID=258475 RepID=A0A4Y7RNF5_9FIRM|nr:Yip1 family protein [Pelotomaculum propionicicum]NLI12925.1 YIP1 family protein [Peptococcaceae bacterium]TEB09827.1 hypothetical protein Pmgp_02828 [Pelotomaculum propionicicum]
MEMQNSENPVPQPEAKSYAMGLWQRISGVLWGGPKIAFENIVALPNTSGIVILLLVLNLALVIPILPKIKEYTIWTIQNTPGAVDLPAAAVNMAATWAAAVSLAGSVAGPLLMWLVIAGLLKLFNTFSGEKAPFNCLFAVTAYSYLPVMLAGLIRTALIMTTPAQNFARVSTSLALLLPGDKIDRLYLILSQVDPFFIWSLALLVIGGSVAMKTAYKNTAMFIGVLWIVYVLALGFLTPINKIGGL